MVYISYFQIFLAFTTNIFTHKSDKKHPALQIVKCQNVGTFKYVLLEDFIFKNMISRKYYGI